MGLTVPNIFLIKHLSGFSNTWQPLMFGFDSNGYLSTWVIIWLSWPQIEMHICLLIYRMDIRWICRIDTPGSYENPFYLATVLQLQRTHSITTTATHKMNWIIIKTLQSKRCILNFKILKSCIMHLQSTWRSF